MGDIAAMQTKSIGVKFEMCEGNDCDANKLEFLKDIQIDTWVIQQQIDYLIYEGRPTQWIQRKVNTNVFAEAIVGKLTPSINVDVVKNEFYMEDDWFQIG